MVQKFRQIFIPFCLVSILAPQGPGRIRWAGGEHGSEASKAQVSSAKGARIETPKAPTGVENGYPFHQLTKGVGGASWALPAGPPGRCPGQKRFWCFLGARKRKGSHCNTGHRFSFFSENLEAEPSPAWMYA